MARWELTWEQGPQVVDIPDDNLAGLIERPEIPPIADPIVAVMAAVDEPLGCQPLLEMAQPGQRVAFLVSDWHDTIFGSEGKVGPALMNRLNDRGIPDDHITVIHAAGLHGHPRAREKLGDEVTTRARYIEHNPLDDRQLAFLGCTFQGTPVWVNRAVVESDLVIGFGGCGPSLYGFQGGGGIILPGVAGADTIRHNHSKIMTTRPMPGWGPGNPMREDVLDAADMAGLSFKIDITAAGTVVAGKPRVEWPVAVSQVRERVMVAPPETPDIYVMALDNPRGRHLATGLYMSVELAAQTVRPGGIVIMVVSACASQPITNRPLQEILDETTQRTAQWADPAGDTHGERRFWQERDMHCKEELLCYPLEELTRVVVRQQGEPRSTCMSWSHRFAIEQTRVFLVSEGIPAETGGKMGFKLTTLSFAAALEQAFAELGRDARVVANVPPRNGIPRVP